MYYRRLREVIRDNYIYYCLYALLLMAGIILQATRSQQQVSLFINGLSFPAADYFFRYITFLGDGVFATMVVVILFFTSRRYWLAAAVSFALASGITQALKRLVFPDVSRPAIIMKDIPGLHYVEGVYMNEMNSFPSGHTLTAFAVFTFVALISRQKKESWIFLLVALLVGVSRIYLLQHFFQDVVVGSMIGVMIPTFTLPVFFKTAEAHA